MSRREIVFTGPLDAARRAIAEVAEVWEAEWREEIDGGRLRLPVVHGLRRGTESGLLRLRRESAELTRIEWTLEQSELEVQRPAVAILVFAAVPLVGTLVWPFWPGLLPLVPFAAISGLIAWWLVISRLRHRGPEEFLSDVAKVAALEVESSDPVVR
jgi:hypothetical protein